MFFFWVFVYFVSFILVARKRVRCINILGEREREGEGGRDNV